MATVRTATATAAAGRVLGWPGLARVVVLTAGAGLSMPQHWVCVCVVGGIEDDVDCLGTGARGGCSKSSTSMAGFVGSRWPRDGWVCSRPRCRWVCAANNFVRVNTGRGLQVEKMTQKWHLLEKPWNSFKTIVRRGSVWKIFLVTVAWAEWGPLESWPRRGRLRRLYPEKSFAVLPGHGGGLRVVATAGSAKVAAAAGRVL